MVLLQLLEVGSIIAGLITWLLRSLMCKAKNEVINQAILVTGCDSGIGHELAKHLDSLGFYVFAACLDTSSEGAQRLRYDCLTKMVHSYCCVALAGKFFYIISKFANITYFL